MIGRRGMNDVRAVRARHVAARAIVVRAACQPRWLRKPATPIGVALQAAIPVVTHPFLRCGSSMRVMAGDALHPALAGAETAALVHLLDLADEPGDLPAPGPDED